LFEIKALTYAERLSGRYKSLKDSAVEEILAQSKRQIEASGGRPIVWVFAEKEAAEMVRDLFNTAEDGRQYITVVYIFWTKSNP
jgi:NADPH-dependent ferric siderophore reductase